MAARCFCDNSRGCFFCSEIEEDSNQDEDHDWSIFNLHPNKLPQLPGPESFPVFLNQDVLPSKPDNGSSFEEYQIGSIGHGVDSIHNISDECLAASRERANLSVSSHTGIQLSSLADDNSVAITTPTNDLPRHTNHAVDTIPVSAQTSVGGAGPSALSGDEVSNSQSSPVVLDDERLATDSSNVVGGASVTSTDDGQVGSHVLGLHSKDSSSDPINPNGGFWCGEFWCDICKLLLKGSKELRYHISSKHNTSLGSHETRLEYEDETPLKYCPSYVYPVHPLHEPQMYFRELNTMEKRLRRSMIPDFKSTERRIKDIVEKGLLKSKLKQKVASRKRKEQEEALRIGTSDRTDGVRDVAEKQPPEKSVKVTTGNLEEDNDCIQKDFPLAYSCSRLVDKIRHYRKLKNPYETTKPRNVDTSKRAINKTVNLLEKRKRLEFSRQEMVYNRTIEKIASNEGGDEKEKKYEHVHQHQPPDCDVLRSTGHPSPFEGGETSVVDQELTRIIGEIRKNRQTQQIPVSALSENNTGGICWDSKHKPTWLDSARHEVGVNTRIARKIVNVPQGENIRKHLSAWLQPKTGKQIMSLNMLKENVAGQLCDEQAISGDRPGVEGVDIPTTGIRIKKVTVLKKTGKQFQDEVCMESEGTRKLNVLLTKQGQDIKPYVIQPGDEREAKNKKPIKKIKVRVAKQYGDSLIKIIQPSEARPVSEVFGTCRKKTACCSPSANEETLIQRTSGTAKNRITESENLNEFYDEPKCSSHSNRAHDVNFLISKCKPCSVSLVKLPPEYLIGSVKVTEMLVAGGGSVVVIVPDNDADLNSKGKSENTSQQKFKNMSRACKPSSVVLEDIYTCSTHKNNHKITSEYSAGLHISGNDYSSPLTKIWERRDVAAVKDYMKCVPITSEKQGIHTTCTRDDGTVKTEEDMSTTDEVMVTIENVEMEEV